ncbi:MAG: response regulator transcription factor [Thermomicrobiales bacterium]
MAIDREALSHTGRHVRALIIEDTCTIAKLVQRGLVLEGIHAEMATDGRHGLDVIRREPPDLIVLDLGLPDIDGLELCKRVRRLDRSLERLPTAILMLTARDSVPDRVAGLDAGADDYLAKPFAIDELLARVRALLRRRSAVASSAAAARMLKYDDVSVDLGSRIARRGERIMELTAREYDLLCFFLRHPDQVLEHERIRELVWGSEYFGVSNVIAVTVASLRRAMEEQGEPRLIQTIHGVGYVLRPRPDGKAES